MSVPGLTVLPVDESRGTVDDPTASLAELNRLKPHTGENVILGLEIPFFGVCSQAFEIMANESVK